MNSTSKRSYLRQGILSRAKSGLSALPAGIARGFRAWLELRREVRRMEEHVVHDVGFQLRRRARAEPTDVRYHP